MTSSVQIQIDVLNKASAELAKVSADLAKMGKTGETVGKQTSTLGKATDVLKKQFGGLASGLLGPIAGITTLGTAVMAAGKFVMSSVKDWTAYNEEVRKLGVATGASVDDLSRMMQAADDVGVSMDAMKTAMMLAAKNGVQPTVENMAKLSDQMLAIKDPTQRAAEMSKIFGRGWAEVAGFVLKGGDAIRASTEAINDNLVVTDESVQMSREYAIATDELAESKEILGNMIAKTVTPAITSATIEYNKFATSALDLDSKTQLLSLSFEQWIQYLFQGATLTELLGGKVETTSGKFDDMAEAARNAGVAEGELAAASGELTTALDIVELSTRKYNDTLLLTMLSAELNAEEQLKLREALGLVDETTLYAAKRMQQLNKAFENGKLTAEQYAKSVQALQWQIDRLEGKTIQIITEFITFSGGGGIPDPLQGFNALSEMIQKTWVGYTPPSGGGGGGGGGGTSSGGGDPMPNKKENEAAWNKWFNRQQKLKDATKKKPAIGGAFMVPPGYPGDNYPMGVTSGEQVIVIPQSQTSNNYNLTINSNARTENLQADFALLQVMNG